jgi:hypothetical protein
MFTVATAKTQKRQTLLNDIRPPPKVAIAACVGWLIAPTFPRLSCGANKPGSYVTPETLSLATQQIVISNYAPDDIGPKLSMSREKIFPIRILNIYSYVVQYSRYPTAC